MSREAPGTWAEARVVLEDYLGEEGRRVLAEEGRSGNLWRAEADEGWDRFTPACRKNPREIVFTLAEQLREGDKGLVGGPIINALPTKWIDVEEWRLSKV